MSQPPNQRRFALMVWPLILYSGLTPEGGVNYLRITETCLGAPLGIPNTQKMCVSYFNLSREFG